MIKYEELVKDLSNKKFAPVYLLMGEEPFYIDRICVFFENHIIDEQDRDFNQTVLYGKDTTAADVIASAKQFPFGSPTRVVIVKEAKDLKDIDKLLPYVQNPSPTTILVICFKTNNDITRKGKSVDKRTSFYKKACNVGVVFESEQLPDYKMPRWIEEYFATRGLKIAPDAAALLAEYAGVDIAKIVMETDKLLKVLPPDTPQVTAADIAANVGMSRDYSAFELTKALSTKDIEKCYRIAHFFAESEKRFPLVMIMSAISSHFLKILRYHALQQAGVPRAEILSQLGINPYFGAEYDKAVRNYPLRKTMKVISLLREYDQRSKSNARGSASDGELLNELISKILA